MTCSCGIVSSTPVTTTKPRVSAIAAIGTSVNVENITPTVTRPSSATTTTAATRNERRNPDPSDTVSPDSSVKRPSGNSAAPVTRPTRNTVPTAAQVNTTAALHFVS